MSNFLTSNTSLMSYWSYNKQNNFVFCANYQGVDLLSGKYILYYCPICGAKMDIGESYPKFGN